MGQGCHCCWCRRTAYSYGPSLGQAARRWPGSQGMAAQPHPALSPSQSTAGPSHTLETIKHQIVRATGRECGGKMQHSEQLLRSPDGLMMWPHGPWCGQGVFEGSKVMEGISMCIRIWFSSRCIGSAFYRLKKKITESQKKHHLGKAAYGVQILCLYPCAGNWSYIYSSILKETTSAHLEK